MRRIIFVLPLSALALAMTASPSAATVNLGQTGIAGGSNCGSPLETVQPTVTSGPSYVAPAAGRITSWSTQAGGAGLGGPARLKVYRPVAGSATSFTVVGRDAERALVLNTLNTFNLVPGIAVQKGDIIGLGSSTGVYACTFAVPGETRNTAFTDVADGGTVNTTVNTGFRLNVSAVLDPTSSISIASTAKNKKKGNATLTVNVPNPGTLSLTGTGVAAGDSIVATAGTVEVKVRALGKKKRKLLGTGKAKVTPSLTFTPTGGSASTPVAQQVQLKKK